MKNIKMLEKEYLYDMKIIKGLYATIDPEKIKLNMEFHNFNISHFDKNTSKGKNKSIVSIDMGNNRYVQYIVKQNLKIKELNKLDRSFMPPDIKLMILEAYDLAKVKHKVI